jgi:hypothetical protein
MPSPSWSSRATCMFMFPWRGTVDSFTCPRTAASCACYCCLRRLAAISARLSGGSYTFAGLQCDGQLYVNSVIHDQLLDAGPCAP